MNTSKATSWLDDDCRKANTSIPGQTSHATYPRRPKELRHKCPNCQMVFKDTWHLRRHMNTHESYEKDGGQAADLPEVLPKCRICGKDVPETQFGPHALEHVDLVFEEMKGGRPCAACHIRRAQAQSVLQVMNGRYGACANMVNVYAEEDLLRNRLKL